MVKADDNRLPALRTDIRIDHIDGGSGGQSYALIIDPVRSGYFQLHWPLSLILPLWSSATSGEQLRQRVWQDHEVEISQDDLNEAIEFLHQNQLTQADSKGTWHEYHALSAASRHSWYNRLIHNYLFFRLPLLHPQSLLERALPKLEFIFTRGFATTFLIMIAAGGYLTSRQSGVFLAMFSDLDKLPSLLIFAAVLLMLKLVHELGHALITVRLGCRVPSMGIAFMLGAPVFYTDTTDSWRLPRRIDRLKIVTAGVGAELIVAGFALLLWPFLPEGLGRQLCFAVMTSAIAMTLLINLNPFMRYDGYFALSDYLDVPNLQNRAFAMAIWRLREILFRLGQDSPEDIAPRMKRVLIVYAWLTWAYRFVLFAGIAAIVYAITVKALGIFLAAFEIAFFIVRPVVMEIKEWWDFRDLIMRRQRIFVTSAAALCAAAVFFVPWIERVQAPVMLSAGNEAPLHLSESAHITAIHVKEGQRVRAGTVMFQASSPQLVSRLNKSRLELRALKMKYGQLTALKEERDQRLVILNEIGRARERVSSLADLVAKLAVRAPFEGLVVDIDPGLHAGVWHPQGRPLATLISTEGVRARGVVLDTDLDRIATGAAARFIPDDANAPSWPMRLTAVSAAGDLRMSEPALAETNGGPVAADEKDGILKARQGTFEVALAGLDSAPQVATRGIVQIEAAPVSPFELVWRQVARVLVREQGF